MHARKELRDARADEAPHHVVGHDLVVVVYEFQVGQVILRAVVLIIIRRRLILSLNYQM